MIDIEVPSVDVQYDALNVISDVSKQTVAQETFWIEAPKTVYSEVSAAVVDSALQLNIMKGPIKSCNLHKHSLILESQAGSDQPGSVKYNVNFAQPLTAPGQANITTLDINDSENWAVYGDSDGGLKLVDINEDGNLRRNLTGHLIYTTVAKFFPSGQVIISGGSDMQIKIWSAIDGSNPRTLLGHTGTINSIEIVGRGRNVLSASKDGTVRLWECGSGQTVRTLDRGKEVVSIALLSDDSSHKNNLQNSPLDFETEGKALVVSTGTDACIWDVRDSSGQTLAIDKNHQHTQAVATGGNNIALADSTGFVSIYDRRNLTEPCFCVYRPTNERSSIKSVHLDGNILTVLDNSTYSVDLHKPEDKVYFIDQFTPTCMSVHKSRLYTAGPFGISQHEKYQ